MPLEAIYQQDGCTADYTPVAAVTAGTVLQLPDGRAGIAAADIAAGQQGAVIVRGRVTVQKTTSMVLLAGGRAFWDHSANKAHYKTVNDRDFYLGTVCDDAAAADTTVVVDLNAVQRNTLDLLNGPVLSVPTGTQAAGSGGFGLAKVYGGSQAILLSATSEAQCIDLFSVDRVAKTACGIAEFELRVAANGSTSDVDFNVGIANETHTSNADSIAESVFFHVDGGSLVVNAESDDGTTENAAATTGVSLTAGAAVSDRLTLWIDFRDPTDIQLYVNGANVLPSTVFTLAAATGPLGLLVHLEKASGTATAGPVYIDRAVLRTMEENGAAA